MKKLMGSNSKNNEGFTLVELLVSIALLGMVITLVGGFVNFSTIFEKKAEKEVDFQASMRQASRVINNSIRDSSVSFALSDTVFSGNKKAEWSYIGIEDHKSIVQYIWNPITATHDAIVLVPSSEAISYNLTFSQPNPNSKLIEFTLDGIVNGESTPKLTINSELNAMNSIAVEDRGSSKNPSVAMAYRTDLTPTPKAITINKKEDIAITLVLDYSGSMKLNMAGNTTSNIDKKRITIMKKEALKLMEKYKTLGAVKVAVIPFSTVATYPTPLKDISIESNFTDLKNQINAPSANGGTNTGDGLRCAYHALKEYQKDLIEKPMNYIILLTDGDPTFRSSNTTSGTYDAKLGSGLTTSDYVWGVGNNDPDGGGQTNLANSLNYTKSIGNMIKQDTGMKINTFVIGFSAKEDDIGNNSKIAGYCNGTYYAAASSLELDWVFTEITSIMIKDTWHIDGPY